jgi:hypothetical protein
VVSRRDLGPGTAPGRAVRTARPAASALAGLVVEPGREGPGTAMIEAGIGGARFR